MLAPLLCHQIDYLGDVKRDVQKQLLAKDSAVQNTVVEIAFGAAEDKKESRKDSTRSRVGRGTC